MDNLNPSRDEQVSVESYKQLRAKFRFAHHADVRRREGLPAHDGEKYVIGDSRSGLVVGRVTGVGSGVPLGNAWTLAGSDTSFDIRITSLSDLAREVIDLDEAASGYALSEAVRFDQQTLPRGFDIAMHPEVLEDEVELLAWLAAVNKGLPS